MVGMSTGEELLEERPRRRGAGDPRLTPEDREILGRLVSGGLTEEFQAALNAVSAARSCCWAVAIPATAEPARYWS